MRGALAERRNANNRRAGPSFLKGAVPGDDELH